MQTYRIGIQTWGSDGDILPFFGLAKALVNSGHRVTMVVTSVDGKDYRELGRSIGAEVLMVVIAENRVVPTRECLPVGME